MVQWLFIMYVYLYVHLYIIVYCIYLYYSQQFDATVSLQNSSGIAKVARATAGNYQLFQPTWAEEWIFFTKMEALLILLGVFALVSQFKWEIKNKQNLFKRSCWMWIRRFELLQYKIMIVVSAKSLFESWTDDETIGTNRNQKQEEDMAINDWTEEICT